MRPRLCILAGAVGIPLWCAALAAQSPAPPRRAALSIGLAGGRYEYDASGTGMANNVGVTVGWHRTPRWLDVESRLTFSRFRQQSGIFTFDPMQGFLEGGPRALTLTHLEHQIALIAPWMGLRPYVGLLLGTSLATGERDYEFPLGSSIGASMGLRLQGDTGPNVGTGLRVRALDHIGMFAAEVTFDVRFPIR
ncbi:MAG: hypothetical protein ACK53A_07675 [Gemmatimonadota bacterium]|jgi:hypothetical protein